MKIDIFPHIFPPAYFDKVVETVPNKDAIRRWTNIPVLYDLEARLRMMEEFGEYQQILTLSRVLRRIELRPRPKSKRAH